MAIHCTTAPNTNNIDQRLESIVLAIDYLIKTPKIAAQLRGTVSDDA